MGSLWTGHLAVIRPGLGADAPVGCAQATDPAFAALEARSVAGSAPGQPLSLGQREPGVRSAAAGCWRLVRRLWLVAACVVLGWCGCRPGPEALRVWFYVAAGPSTNAAQTQPWLRDWPALLKQRGAVVQTSTVFPSARQLARVQVLVVHGPGAWRLTAEQRATLDRFVQQGGGLVLLHQAAESSQPEWLVEWAGGALVPGPTNWLTARLPMCGAGPAHPITQGLAWFDLQARFAAQVQLSTQAQVIARALWAPEEARPQAWVYEAAGRRVFALLPEPGPEGLHLAHWRGLILRGIAWAAQRPTDALLRPEELDSFGWPVGGPTRPEQAGSRIEVRPEFELELVAAEPVVVNPVALDWDAQGRLWVALMPEPAEGGTWGQVRPCVALLTDRNGDGRLDSRTVFYEGVRPITALTFYRGGLILAQPPDILWVCDADGDGVVDRRQVLYQGFGRTEPQASLSNFRWGLDGWVYGAVGRGGQSSLGVTGADGRSFGPIGPGLFRFKPDGTALEQVVRVTNNVWGFDFSWDGELFFAQAPGSHLSQVLMPERFVGPDPPERVPAHVSLPDHHWLAARRTDEWLGWPRAGIGNNLFRSAAGLLVYGGGAWPARYDGSCLVCEPAAGVVHEDLLCATETMTWEATRRDEEELLASTDLWFHPIQIRSGPDGAAYVLDFYSRLGFGPISSGTERPAAALAGTAMARPGPAAYGRIWRLQHRRARRLSVPDLENAGPVQWVQALEHPNGWVRWTAQRLLVESGDRAVGPRLTALLTNRLPYVRVHALWTLQQLGLLEPDQLALVLTNQPHPLVQRAACRVAEAYTGLFTPQLQQALVRELRTADDRTRWLGVLALRNAATDTNVIQTALRMFPDLPNATARAAVLALARQAPLAYVRAAFDSSRAEACRGLVVALVEGLARNRQSAELGEVVQIAANRLNRADRLTVAVLDSVGQSLGPELDLPWSQALEDAVGRLLRAHDRTVRLAALPLATLWPDRPELLRQAEQVRDSLLAELLDPRLRDEERLALVTNLFRIKFLQPQLWTVVEEVLRRTSSVPVQRALIQELGRVNDPQASAILMQNYSVVPEELRPGLLASASLRAEGAAALLDALERQEVPVRDLDLSAMHRLRHHPDPAVARRAVALFDWLEGAPKSDRQAVLAQFLHLTNGLGDPVPREWYEQGRPVYRQHCEACHRFATHAPRQDWAIDLTAAGARGAAWVLGRLLDPNRTAAGPWLAWNVTTHQGVDYFGALGPGSADRLSLRTAQGTVEVPLADVVSTNCTGASLMPEGFERLGWEPLRHLLAYVLGHAPRGFRPLDLSGVATADSRQPLFDPASPGPELLFNRFGMVLLQPGGVPFHILHPAETASGKNLLVLRGGPLQHLPQRVELNFQAEAAPVGLGGLARNPAGSQGLRASRLHVLGGVAGWGYPFGDAAQQSAPAAKLVFRYTDGLTHEVVLHNGEQFADYAQGVEVPGSTLATNLVQRGQVRWFTVELPRRQPLAALTLESFNNHLAPVFVALTAQQ